MPRLRKTPTPTHSAKRPGGASIPIAVLLADDQGIMRDGLTALVNMQPDMRVVAAVSNGEDAVDATDHFGPDLVVMDVSMPLMNGIDAARAIMRANPGMSILMLSASTSPAIVRSAVHAGARGYLPKTSTGREFVSAVRSVGRGTRYFSSGIRGMIADTGFDDATGLDLLSKTEREIIRLAANGETSAEIATALKLSTRTVETYRLRIMEKLGISRLASLIKYAIRLGIAQLD